MERAKESAVWGYLLRRQAWRLLEISAKEMLPGGSAAKYNTTNLMKEFMHHAKDAEEQAQNL